ncbi:MAG: hypothetical protein PVG66_01065 [Chromatiales bacterium]|jgi:hypothetical protein
MADISSSNVTHPVGHIDATKKVDPKKKRQQTQDKDARKRRQKKQGDDDNHHIDVFA